MSKSKVMNDMIALQKKTARKWKCKLNYKNIQICIKQKPQQHSIYVRQYYVWVCVDAWLYLVIRWPLVPWEL